MSLATFSRSDEIRAQMEQDLLSRCERNPRYSLRSYARRLGIGYSDLSKILRGTRKVTEKMYARIKDSLPVEMASPVYTSIDQDQFRLISEWYHFAILALVKTAGFQPRFGWIAKRLGISPLQARTAVERLERLKLLSCRKGWRVLSANTTTVSNASTSGALRRLQTAALQNAIRAVDEIPVEERDQSTFFMAIDRSRLPEAIRRLDKYRREICEYLEAGTADDVFCLSTSLFSLSRLSQGVPK